MDDLIYEKMRTVSDQDWLSGLCREANYEWCSALPVLPDESFQRRFVGRANSEAMSQAFEAIEKFKDGLCGLGCDFDATANVVDFGCGWGRISQSLYRYFKPSNILSADIQSEALEFCRQSGLATNLVHVSEDRLGLQRDSTVDFVFAFSVFSHLSEHAANIWIAEFFRILRPGGGVAITTRATSILRHVANLKKQKEIPPHANGLIEAFPDPDAALKEYSEGKFVYRDYPNNSRCGKGYGEALIPEAYVRNCWEPKFGGGYQFFLPSGRIDQAIIILRKS